MSDDKSTGEKSFIIGSCISPRKYVKDNRDYSYITKQNDLQARGEITSEERDRNVREFLDKLNKSESESKEKGAVPQTENKQVTLLRSPVTNEQYQSIPGDARDKFRDNCINRKKELQYQINIGKISQEEAQQTYAEFTTKLYMETENKSQGAVPKIIVSSMDKFEKSLQKHLNKNKLNCQTCRRLNTGILNEKTKTVSRETASKHLASQHGIKIPLEQAKGQAPPSSGNETDMEVSTQDTQKTSQYTRIFTSQDELLTDFPPLPTVASGISSPMKTDKTRTSTQERDEEGFIRPRTKGKRKASPPQDEEISTQNKYLLLTDSEDAPSTLLTSEYEENENFSRKSKNPSKQKTTPPIATGNKKRNPKGINKLKKNLPPPIIIKSSHGRNNYFQIQQRLKDILTKGYTLKYTKNNIIIYAVDPEQYEQLRQNLISDTTIEWHTYATMSEKTHGFVIKGLDNMPEINDIQQELEEKNIKVTKIYPMQTKYRMLYLVITPATVLLRQLQNIKYLGNVEVRWELRKKYNEISQCKRCLSWGHSAIYCRRKLKCQNCGETHEEGNIEEPCTREVKCANCGKNHRASDTNCDTYKYRVEKIQQQKDKEFQAIRKIYKDATAPTENIWKIRKDKLTQARQEKEGYTTDSEESEEEGAAAFPPTTRRRPRQPNQQQQKDNESYSNVSELLELNREFKSLGTSLAEVIRFLRDFLSIFKAKNQEERAFAFLNILLDINKYKF